MLIKISDYPVHESEAERWKSYRMASDLHPFNNKATADTVFRYLNRPIPQGVQDSDLVDCSAALPELVTLEQMADRAGIDMEDAQFRYDHSCGEDYHQGKNKNGEWLFYWEECERWLKEELLSVNKIADLYGIDRRTVKKKLHQELASRFCRIGPPVVQQQGTREFTLWWESCVDKVFG